MRTILYIGHKATKEQVEQLNQTIKGEVVSMFDSDMYAIVGDDTAKNNFNILKAVAEGIKQPIEEHKYGKVG